MNFERLMERNRLLLFRIDLSDDLLGDQGRVVAGGVLIMRSTWTLFSMASFLILAVSSIISASSIPGTILSNGNALAEDSS